MAKLGQHQIREFALDLVRRNPGGVRFKDIVSAVISAHPETPRNTVMGSIWDLEARFPDVIMKPTRGLYKLTSAGDNAPPLGDTGPTPTSRPAEAMFYEPFAAWLKDEADEVTEARAMGGAWVRNKWSTPDVVGVYKPRTRDLVKFPIEIVSAEIKIDPTQPVVAFGQAIAYRLFSMKAYIAMPATMAADDRDRLEAICTLYGVGLVLFRPEPSNPDFELVARAQRFAPDMFYVNEFADRLRQYDHAAFDALFG